MIENKIILMPFLPDSVGVKRVQKCFQIEQTLYFEVGETQAARVANKYRRPNMKTMRYPLYYVIN